MIVTSTPTGITPSLLMISSTDQDESLKAGFDELEDGKGRYKGGGARGRFMSKVEGKWGKSEDELVTQLVAQVSLIVTMPKTRELTEVMFRSKMEV